MDKNADTAQPIGHVKTEEGLMITRAGADGKPSTLHVQDGAPIYATDILKTTPDSESRATIKLHSGQVMNMGAGATLDMSQWFDPKKASFTCPVTEGVTCSTKSVSAISGTVAKATPDEVRWTNPPGTRGGMGGVRG